MRYFIFCFFTLYSIQAFTQKNHVKELTINTEIYPILKSLYGKIDVVDNRINNSIIIQYDSLDRYSNKTKFKLQPDLKVQLEEFYKENIGSIAQFINRKALLVVHEYNVHNDYGSNIFKIKGDLFLVEKDKFFQLGYIDTVIFGDETNVIVFFNNHSGSIYNLILNSALFLPDYSQSYSKDFTSNLDSIIKSKTSFYFAKNLMSGIYYSFSNLTKLKPNFKFDDSDINDESNIQNSLNNMHGIEYDSIYALVFDNNLYIPIRKKWCKMEKIGSDYYCDIKMDNIYIKKSQSKNLGKEFSDLKNMYYKYYSATNPALYNLMLYGFSAPWFRFKLNCRTGHLSFIQGIEKPRSASKAR